jgi:hypothetical protein
MSHPLAEIVERVIHPLVCGGELRLVAPIGAKRAIEHARAAAQLADFSGQVENEIQWQRLRIARQSCPVDRVPALGYGEWLLLCALNDLLQATNPDLPGLFSKTRPLRLVKLAHEMIAAAGAPRTVGEALWRHATLSRTLELTRVDTHVSWWVGSRTFRGSRPPSRLLAWQSVRRVRQQHEEVPLASMVGAGATWASAWQVAIMQLIAATPLTDLSNVLRLQPSFVWTGATLGLLATAPGRTLAHRVLDRTRSLRRAQETLALATHRLAQADPRAAELAAAFVKDLSAAPSARPTP